MGKLRKIKFEENVPRRFPEELVSKRSVAPSTRPRDLANQSDLFPVEIVRRTPPACSGDPHT
jgi:hypothetical protein